MKTVKQAVSHERFNWMAEIHRDGLHKRIDAVVVLCDAKPKINQQRLALACQLFWNYPFTTVILAGTTKELNESEYYLFSHFVPQTHLVRLWAPSVFDAVQNVKHWGMEQFNEGHVMNRLVFIGHQTVFADAMLAHEFTFDIPNLKCEFQAVDAQLKSEIAILPKAKAMGKRVALALFPFFFLTKNRFEKSPYAKYQHKAKFGFVEKEFENDLEK